MKPNRPCLPGLAMLYEAGVTVRAIKRMTGHHDHIIYRALRDLSVPLRNPAGCMSAPFSLEHLRQRYKAGATTTQLAEQYECDQRTIAKYLRAAGAEMRCRGRRRRDGRQHKAGWAGFAQIDRGAVLSDAAAGILPVDIAVQRGISLPTVRRILAKAKAAAE